MDDLRARFEEAAKRAKGLPAQSNETLLDLYALYKQATTGDVTGDRPGMFDMVGRAKYDAWAERQGMTTDDAKQEYVDLVSKLET